MWLLLVPLWLLTTLGYINRIGFMTLLIYLLFTILYTALFNYSKLQATPGKLLVGIKVCDEQSKRISFLRALARTLLIPFSILPLLIGYIMVLFNDKRQALHDKLAKTLVIKNTNN